MTHHACVFGLGWGDEGKGKVVDLLCPAFDFVVRFNGGANAGHTVCVGQERFALHLLPTGALHAHTTAVIGPGVVADPLGLLAEIDNLAERGIDVLPRLRISDRAHLVMPYHILEDKLSEGRSGAATRIGTTARGIGPCYADKMRRSAALRFGDLIGGLSSDTELAERSRGIVADRQRFLACMYGQDVQLDVETILSDLANASSRLGPLICDTTALLHEALDAQRPILFEGANGMLLDVDHGTYPFVTSSSTGPHGIGSGAGVPPNRVTHRIGVAKAYATRVGSGPFVSELTDAVGDRIRTRGNEFGTTTGRPRRCGWFDVVATRFSTRISDATDLAILHLDTLSGFEEVSLCVGYELNGRAIATPPADAGTLERIQPVVETLPGWADDISHVRSFDELPKAARDYIEQIESLVGVAVSIIGVGPERSQTILRGPLWERVRLPACSSML